MAKLELVTGCGMWDQHSLCDIFRYESSYFSFLFHYFNIYQYEDFEEMEIFSSDFTLNMIDRILVFFFKSFFHTQVKLVKRKSLD